MKNKPLEATPVYGADWILETLKAGAGNGTVAVSWSGSCDVAKVSGCYRFLPNGELLVESSISPTAGILKPGDLVWVKKDRAQRAFVRMKDDKTTKILVFDVTKESSPTRQSRNRSRSSPLDLVNHGVCPKFEQTRIDERTAPTCRFPAGPFPLPSTRMCHLTPLLVAALLLQPVLATATPVVSVAGERILLDGDEIKLPRPALFQRPHQRQDHRGPRRPPR